MTLTVDLSVRGETIGQVLITNVGAPEGMPYATADPGGLRRYVWSCSGPALGDQHGEVLHARSDGAASLAAKVLDRIYTFAPGPIL